MEKVMEKLDFKKKYKELFTCSSKEVSVVIVPELLFLMVDGQGDPNGAEFQKAVEALYSVSYTLKFWAKKHTVAADFAEYSVAPLEAQWWVEGSDGRDYVQTDRSTWRWTAMMLQPDFITPELVKAAKAEVAAKKFIDASGLRLERFAEGDAVQVMHLGPYSDELADLNKIDTYMQEHGLQSNGKHHEIYMNDPRRVTPDKLKTILRHPVKAIQ